MTVSRTENNGDENSKSSGPTGSVGSGARVGLCACMRPLVPMGTQDLPKKWLDDIHFIGKSAREKGC